MSLPTFFSRVSDSIGPLLSHGYDVQEFVASKVILLEAPDEIEQHLMHRAGFLLLTNLCARLYPTLRVCAPSLLAEECRSLALSINPDCDFAIGKSASSAAVAWACSGSNPDAIVVGPSGWEVLVDLPAASQLATTNMLVALAAAAIAASELFRQIFTEFLPHGRTGSTPGRFNLLTHAPTSAELPELPSDIALGRVHLVGAGAVGQSAVYALARVSATGTIIVVDPEEITLSNLQRYVLAIDGDVDSSKCALVERELKETRLDVISVRTGWSADLPATSAAEVICAAVDTEALRIELQSSLPRRMYNAWTQPGDIGWSRHEQFGDAPCIACLYWPSGPRPNYHELVARVLHQHELRVLGYLTYKVPVDAVLNPSQVPKLPQYALPPEVAFWSARSLLDDVAVKLGVSPEDLVMWRGRSLQDLYHEGICGGAIVRKNAGALPIEMAVPLAHQSVLAGIMLATELLVAARPDLTPYRNSAIEARLDLLAGIAQISARPRQKTANCLCDDIDFVERYREKWPW